MVWLVMILPFAVFINSVAVSIDVFHPISWLNGMEAGGKHNGCFMYRVNIYVYSRLRISGQNDLNLI